MDKITLIDSSKTPKFELTENNDLVRVYCKCKGNTTKESGVCRSCGLEVENG